MAPETHVLGTYKGLEVFQTITPEGGETYGFEFTDEDFPSLLSVLRGVEAYDDEEVELCAQCASPILSSKPVEVYEGFVHEECYPAYQRETKAFEAERAQCKSDYLASVL